MNEALLQITVNTQMGTFKEDLGEQLRINVDNISESMIDQPGKYAWWAVLFAKARAKADRAKGEYEHMDKYIKTTLVGELDEEVRKQLELDGEKLTEARVERSIYNHERYEEACNDLKDLKEQWIAAEEDARVVEAGKEAMYQRKDMLVSIGKQLIADGSNASLEVKKDNVRSIIAQSKAKKGSK